ncbi:MAG: quinolinate synthase NadA [Euryarchaeota archaeon]|nr:quinolinate synthase NadA [Euryarchaeota archaeon]MDE1835545.1 quinolinate synthase NadA [Euryarchaeota archaeon]MDE1879636.1 quinolinate synthase NadA [Euryarchaeota archaeon]MDE2043833.1 quinolinate synthase NadA [Thermoplasmata archaeon]
MTEDLAKEVRELKRRRDAVLLAHNYQLGEIQDVADHVGDSLYLSRKAMETDAQVILFSGVKFMAETAKILNPTKTVLLPDLEAGCSLSDSITAEQLRAWKKDHPGAVVVSYVNTSAEVKAESDYCCTSSNALEIVRRVPESQEVLFLPDMFLGNYVKQRTGRKNIHLWVGDCFVHTRMRPETVRRMKGEHPGAELVAHPECGCSTEVLPDVDRVLSTDGMMRYAKETRQPEVLVATEVGILHRMRKVNPQTSFIPLSPEAVCPFMKRNTLEKVRDSLRDIKYRIEVPDPILRRARKALDRMVEATATSPASTTVSAAIA